MRSSSHCEKSYCAPPLCCFPCLPKSKDDAGRGPESGSPSPAAVAEDKPPVVQKMEESAAAPAPATAAATGAGDGVGDDGKCYREVAVVQKMEESAAAPAPAPATAAATGAGAGVGDDGKCYREVAVVPKSCLKKAASCEDSGSKIAAKGNVKWRDLLGKDLTQVKEFEPSESGDSDDEEYTGACACVIQ